MTTKGLTAVLDVWGFPNGSFLETLLRSLCPYATFYLEVLLPQTDTIEQRLKVMLHEFLSAVKSKGVLLVGF